MQSDTPRTDALVEEGGMPYDADFARKLERELAAAKAEIAAAIKQRDEARERYCAEAARHSVCRRSIMDKQTIAQMNGWQGLWKEGGGA